MEGSRSAAACPALLVLVREEAEVQPPQALGFGYHVDGDDDTCSEPEGHDALDATLWGGDQTRGAIHEHD